MVFVAEETVAWETSCSVRIPSSVCHTACWHVQASGQRQPRSHRVEEPTSRSAAAWTSAQTATATKLRVHQDCNNVTNDVRAPPVPSLLRIGVACRRRQPTTTGSRTSVAAIAAPMQCTRGTSLITRTRSARPATKQAIAPIPLICLLRACLSSVPFIPCHAYPTGNEPVWYPRSSANDPGSPARGWIWTWHLARIEFPSRLTRGATGVYAAGTHPVSMLYLPLGGQRTAYSVQRPAERTHKLRLRQQGTGSRRLCSLGTAPCGQRARIGR